MTRLLDDERLTEDLRVIRAFYVTVATKLEEQQARDVLKAELPWDRLQSFHFYDRYELLIRNEQRLADLSAGDIVVFVGGGPLPLTLILLNRRFGVRGISIESSSGMTRLSQRVLNKLGLNEKINTVCADETALSNLHYDAVIIAALAEPKGRVFRNVWRFVSQETKVLYRTYDGMRAVLYAPVTLKALAGFREEARVLPTGTVNNSSVLVKKLCSYRS